MPAELVERFERFLRGKGLRLTRERKTVLGNLLSRDDLPCPEDLRGPGRAVSLATVYRTLFLLRESGLLPVPRTAPLDAPSGPTICGSCGGVSGARESGRP